MTRFHSTPDTSPAIVPPLGGSRSARLRLGALLALLCGGSAIGAPVYDPGALNFSFRDQSIWGSGKGIAPVSLSASTSWNSSATIGGITGEANAVITPGVAGPLLKPAVADVWVPPVPATYSPVYVPRVEILGKVVGCDCYPQLTPEIPGYTIPGTAAVYGPAIPEVRGDTRTGVASSLASRGSVGVTGSFGLNSGTLNADLQFRSALALPGDVKANTFFNLAASQSLLSGSLSGAFPKLQGVISANFSVLNTDSTQVCAFALGCSTNNRTLTDITTGSFKLLELNTANVPDKLSLFGLDAAAFDITRLRVFADYKAPQVIVSVPGMVRPAGASINLGVLDLDLPDLAPSGGLAGGVLRASGRFDNVVRLDADLDGIYGAVAAGGFFAGGVVLDKPPITARLDAVDIKVGPTVDLSQNLALAPTLMAALEFSESVMARMADGSEHEVTNWTGRVDEMPEFALLRAGARVTVTPSYWVRASIDNELGLEFDATVGFDLLKGEVIAGPASTPEWCLRCEDTALPLGRVALPGTRFSVDSSRIVGESFLLRSVPEPGTLALGLLSMALAGRMARRARAAS